jgi:hypothetical protein
MTPSEQKAREIVAAHVTQIKHMGATFDDAGDDLGPAISKAIDDAVREEQEACAKLMDDMADASQKLAEMEMRPGPYEAVYCAQRKIYELSAAAIRSRRLTMGEKHEMTQHGVTYAYSESVEPPYCNKAGMDALAAKDARIAELEALCQTQGVADGNRITRLEAAIKPFARLADIESDGRRDDEIFYSRHGGPDRTVKLTHGDLRTARSTLEGKQPQEAAEQGTEMWAVWNSCNGVFEVTNWRKDALAIIAEAYSEHETAVPVRVLVEDEDRHWLRHGREDEREALWRSREASHEPQEAKEASGAISGPKD